MHWEGKHESESLRANRAYHTTRLLDSFWCPQRVWFFSWPNWHLDGPKIPITSFALTDAMWCACMNFMKVCWFFVFWFLPRTSSCSLHRRASLVTLFVIHVAPFTYQLSTYIPNNQPIHKDRGNYHIHMYLSFIQHTSPEIIRNMHVTILDWIATGACFQDLKLV